MPKKIIEKKAVEINAIVKNQPKGIYPVGGVAGLNIQVNPPNAASWILRTMVNGKRKWIGLGGYPEVTLSKAREKARDIKEKVQEFGYDPVEEKRKKRTAAIKEQASKYTFEQLANEYIEKRSQEFKTQQQVRKLTNLFKNYAYPTIGNMPLSDIDLNIIKSLLEPIWKTKTESANRLRIYIGHVFDIAIARGIYTGLNPARWEGGLKTILAAPQKVSKTTHHKALDLDLMQEFWTTLVKQEWMAAKALQFGILTATRSNEMRGIMWTDINFEDNTIFIPADRMKSGKAHTIPMSEQLIQMLNSMEKFSKYVFPNIKGTTLADASISKVPKRIGYDVTAHGFRSTFKDWARQYVKYNHQPFDDDLSEIALAHVNSDSTRAAYARDQLIEERRPLMQQWADYCCGKTCNNVVPVQFSNIGA